MPRILLLAALLIVGFSVLNASGPGPTTRPKKQMKAFSSEAEMKRFFKNLAKKHKKTGRGGGYGVGDGDSGTVNQTVTVASSAAVAKTSEESITNVQHAGVDEGGIVKVHGDHLVVLRRGRLFTIAIGDHSLRPVDAIDAFGPDLDPEGAWYDEMLISRNNIVVIGYSYEREGTEVGLFRINDDGTLKYRWTYHLRSNDYYSSSNYSSRLIGDRLIFYSPLALDLQDPASSFPAVRRWRKAAKPSDFRRVVTADRIYRPDTLLDDEDITLHTVTECDLSRAEMTCKAASVMGPEGRVFYVSASAVYVWASAWAWKDDNDSYRSILYRMPLDRSPPSAIRVYGSPVDQFSFLEDKGTTLNVLVRSQTGGDGMWNSKVSEGDVALLTLPVNTLADGSTFAPSHRYRALQKPAGYGFQNRFVGDHLLYGTSYDDDEKLGPNTLFLVNWRTGTKTSIPVSHGVGRLDAMGNGAVVIGGKGDDLRFSSIELATGPRLIDTYTLKGAAEGENRSHGFFYKPESAKDGMLGLPIIRNDPDDDSDYNSGSASVLFLKSSSLKFGELGKLNSGKVDPLSDECKASCVDWYGNARPIFLQGRIFALIGYELVEGAIADSELRELRRLDFSPKRVVDTQKN